MPIEGEVIILNRGLNRGQIEFQTGIVFRRGRRARFLIAEGNPEVYIRAGQDVFHIFSYPGFTDAQVTLFSPSLRTVRSGIDGIPPLDVYNGRVILEEAIPPGQKLEMEWSNLLRLTITNNPS